MTFIDSTGIAALLEAHALLRDRGRQMLVANVLPTLRRAFEVLGVGDLLARNADNGPLRPCERRSGRPRRYSRGVDG
jgi:anti-anti-sigma regulatory factor